MRVLVCGSRHFNDRTKLFCDLDDLLFHFPWTGMTIIHGAAKGADTLAGEYARCNNYEVEVYPADWEKHGKAAGHIRNTQMLEEGKPDMVVAFLGPGSRGTANMIAQTVKAGVPLKVVKVP